MVKFTNRYYVEYAFTKTAIITAKSLKDLARILSTQIEPQYIYTPTDLGIAERRGYRYTVTDGRMYLRNSVIHATWIFAFSKAQRERARKRAKKIQKMVKQYKELK